MFIPGQALGRTAEIKGDEVLVLLDAEIPRPQVLLELFVMFEPPEGAPDKDNELGAVLPHALKLADSGAIIFRRAPVGPFFFEKGQSVLHPQR